jgi:glycosyltransferase involved in cell wall biosynthesis
MNVLFTNRNHAMWSGGDSNKINHYMRDLPQRGIKAGYTFSVEDDWSDWDIIHTFHLGHEFSYKFYLEAVRTNKPLVISPIYFPMQNNHLAYRASMVEYASAIAFLSEGEKKAVKELYTEQPAWDMIEEKAWIIPNGINPIFGTEGKKYTHPNCPDEPYILCVGRLDERKNQHHLAQACVEEDIPLLLVGEAHRNPVTDSVNALMQTTPLIWHEPAAPPERLVEAYRGAHTLACPSTLEMWPNVVAEGGMAGCNLVVGESSMTFTDFEGVDVCTPDVDSIRRAIRSSYDTPRRNHSHPFTQYTWERAANELTQLYEEVLN